MKYTLVGAGAIGGSMAAWLSRSGADILYVDVIPEHVQAMNEKGLTILDPSGGDFTVPVKAVLMDDLADSMEVVFLATKTQHTRGAMEKIAPLLKKDGYVVSLQNGLNEYVIAEYVGEERVVGAFVNWAADYIEPGVIQFGIHSHFSIGELDGRVTPRILELRDFCSPFQPVEVTSHIMSRLWSKQVNISAMFATGISLLLIPGGMEFEPSQQAIASLALEAMQVPAKMGIPLESHDDFAPELYRQGRYQQAMRVTADHYRSMVKNYTGLYRDLAVRKRRSEIDGTVGVTVEMGEEQGLDLPMSKKLIEMVHQIEEGKRGISTENLLELAAAFERFYPQGLEELLRRV